MIRRIVIELSADLVTVFVVRNRKNVAILVDDFDEITKRIVRETGERVRAGVGVAVRDSGDVSEGIFGTPT